MKRFVAGAVCPACGAVDRIRVYRDNDCLFQECVACDFRQRMSSAVDGGVDESLVSETDDATPLRFVNKPVSIDSTDPD
jgi:uncharacterized metal-binding protein (TIGR02443 family)